MTALVHTGREAWLLARRELVTASDTPAILGLDGARRSAVDVYLDKIGRGDDSENESMARGRDFEEPIARAYARQTGRTVTALGEFEIQIHRDVSWLGATLDRLVHRDAHGAMGLPWVEKHGPLQLKLATGSRDHWTDEDGEPVAPEAFVGQTQIEIACFGSSWGCLAGMIDMHRPLAIHDLERDDEFLRDALPHLERFRWHVKERIPPPVQDERSLPGVRRLYQGKTSGKTIELDAYGALLVKAWGESRDEARANEEDHRGFEAKLRALLGNDTYAALPDGSYLERRVTAHRDVLHHVRPKNRKRKA